MGGTGSVFGAKFDLAIASTPGLLHGAGIRQNKGKISFRRVCGWFPHKQQWSRLPKFPPGNTKGSNPSAPPGAWLLGQTISLKKF